MLPAARPVHRRHRECMIVPTQPAGLDLKGSDNVDKKTTANA